jgi:hypothetical protein
VKVLIDPIHTNDPQFCVMNFKLQNLMRYWLERREDVFFHYLLPGPKDGDEWAIDYEWLVNSPRVQYHEIPTNKDRMAEYLTVSPELIDLLHFQGPLWDFDMLITSRTPMVPMIKCFMHKMSSLTKNGLRRIVTVDDMPLLEFKKCVGLKVADVQSLQTLSGYLAADSNYLMSTWEGKAAVNLAKNYLAPNKVRQIASKLHDFSPVKTQSVGLKSADTIRKLYAGDRPFTVGYTQRWEKIHRRSQDVLDIMEKQWIRHGAGRNMRFVVTSNSKQFPKRNWLEVYRAPREEFWRMMREEVDVILCLTIDDNYSMALIEPICLGTPAIILDAAYVRPTFGDDYPFIVKNEREAYALVKAFCEDYAGMYEKFAAWSKGTFAPIMEARNDLYLPEVFEHEFQAHEKCVEAFGVDKPDNPVVEALADCLPDEFLLDEQIEKAQYDGRIRGDLLASKDARSRKRSTFNYQEWYRYKADLISRHGYRDASIASGHFVKG